MGNGRFSATKVCDVRVAIAEVRYLCVAGRPTADTRDELLSRSGDHGSLRSHHSPDESSGGAHGAIGHTVQFSDGQARWPLPVVANRSTRDVVVCIIHT
jgi:hypothetical protein